MKKQLKAVGLFHETFGHPVSENPIVEIPEVRKTLRYELMKEENEEYKEAVKNNDLVEVADALGDMLYILCGTIIEHGLQHKIEAVFEEIQRSNMSKLGEDGKPIYREDGKILKGSNYSKPDIKKVLEKVEKKFISIAALSMNEVVAKDGKIPWHLPNDFKRFKLITSGHHIIMGRKTFESLPTCLLNRTHVVITRNKDYKTTNSDVIVVNSLREAMEICPKGTSYIIGGGEIYSEAMPYIDEMDLTIVETIVKGKDLTHFPPATEQMSKFYAVSRIDKPSDKDHLFPYSFIKLVRRTI